MKKIKLKNSYGLYMDGATAMVVDGKLTVEIELPKMQGEFFFTARLKTEDGEIPVKNCAIPQDGIIGLENLKEGTLNVNIKHYLHGEIVAVYGCEGLVIKEVDGNVEGIPEIAYFNILVANALTKLGAQEKANENISITLKRQDEELTKLKQEFSEFKNTCISEIPYITNLKTEEK